VLSENDNVVWLLSPSIPFIQHYAKDIAGRQCILGSYGTLAVQFEKYGGENRMK